MHTLDPKIADIVGVNAAILYQNILWWTQTNAAEKRNFHEGRYWTYNTVEAFNKLFSYLSTKQIRLALKRLQDNNLLLVGNFNKVSFDRTIWYSPLPLPDKDKSDLPQWADDICPEGKLSFAPEGNTIPISKPDINTDNKHSPPSPSQEGGLCESDDLPGNGEEEREQDVPSFQSPERAERGKVEKVAAAPLKVQFESFWNVYPHRGGAKKGKTPAYKKFVTAVNNAATPIDIIAGAVRYQGDRRVIEGYAKDPATWLNQKGWEDEIEPATTASTPRQEHARRQLEAWQRGAIPRENLPQPDYDENYRYIPEKDS